LAQQEVQREVLEDQREGLNNGPAAAAILAAGVGCLAMGLFTVLAAASEALAEGVFNLYDPVGPLSGKTTGAVVVYLVAWAVLHNAWKNRSVDFGRVFVATLVLVALGFLGTFPPFFELFAAEH
jgi:hypothetical protein